LHQAEHFLEILMVNILSAGACKGLFQALFPKRIASGKAQAAFGAVGAMQDRLLAGEACDILVLTLPMLEKLAVEGWVVPGSICELGSVGTGIAISSQLKSVPDVSEEAMLSANLLAATAIHFPDPAKATAGIHFQSVLERLGVLDEVSERCQHYPNGAAAMASLAENDAKFGNLQIGCTQISEILYTKGVRLVGELPMPFHLRTIYAAALTPAGAESERAQKMLKKLTSHKTQSLRKKGGFIL
jgi:molybdate transport system substrate-binding protein